MAKQDYIGEFSIDLTKTGGSTVSGTMTVSDESNDDISVKITVKDALSYDMDGTGKFYDGTGDGEVEHIVATTSDKKYQLIGFYSESSGPLVGTYRKAAPGDGGGDEWGSLEGVMLP